MYTYLSPNLASVIAHTTPIIFANDMYKWKIISKDSYDMMMLLYKIPASVQAQVVVMTTLIIEDTSNPIKYKRFKESLKKQDLYKQLYYAMDSLG